MRSFYLDIKAEAGAQITLPEEESKHICKVLRLNQGDEILLVDGKGSAYTSEITVPHHKRCTVQVKDVNFTEKEPYHIHIALSPTKNIDRFEWFLEKSTELGIHEITPLLCEHNERKTIKIERCKKILTAAMKQSKRSYLPQLNPLTNFDQFINTHQKGFIAHCYDEKKSSFEVNIEKTNFNQPIIIGPEGDFSPTEVSLALEKGYTPITLGKTRLRTETAGIYACSLLKHYLE